MIIMYTRIGLVPHLPLSAIRLFHSASTMYTYTTLCKRAPLHLAKYPTNSFKSRKGRAFANDEMVPSGRIFGAEPVKSSP